MEAIEVKIENGLKKINNQNIETIINGLDSSHTNINKIKEIFEKISSENDLILELKKIYKENTPITILKYIMFIGNLSISEANPILEKVLEE
jgi:hypothetical protein